MFLGVNIQRNAMKSRIEYVSFLYGRNEKTFLTIVRINKTVCIVSNEFWYRFLKWLKNTPN